MNFGSFRWRGLGRKNSSSTRKEAIIEEVSVVGLSSRQSDTPVQSMEGAQVLKNSSSLESNAATARVGRNSREDDVGLLHNQATESSSRHASDEMTPMGIYNRKRR